MARWLTLLAFVLVLGVPFAVRPPEARAPADTDTLVIITPHVEPIRAEFAQGFDRWHRARFGKPVAIDWRVPGGTSDIQKQLKSVYESAITSGQLKPDGTLAFDSMPFDLFFGGGVFEHSVTKAGVRARPPGSNEEVSISMSVPAGLPQSLLDEVIGENAIGPGMVYDPEQYWIGTAFSGFGIVFNRDLLRRFNLPDPKSWSDMCRPELAGWVALADPRQSGSVATLFDSVLNNYGWEKGWRTLRMMSANSRYFTNSAPKVPIDVSQGEAAMGVAISHYGRYQAQMVMRPGETPQTSRVGYVDPPGEVFIDADPVSLLRGGPHPELARRFIEYCLTEEGQSLWQFRVRSADDPSPLGPRQFELRRMPVRRSMYTRHLDQLVDKDNPYELASKVKERGWRDAVGPLMGAFGIDTHDELVRAWEALNRARASGAPGERIAQMETAFFAFPEWHTPDAELPFNEHNIKLILPDLKRASRDGRMPAIKVRWIRFFRDKYAEVERLAAQ